ncbi:helix-turn-helix domain-containing protein [Yersinia ruckeri]|nr:phage repressor protein CI [Yersinia ruckeri]UZX55805.1 helix-turn-helix domain-containing protein [Yersinia ruckeri]
MEKLIIEFSSGGGAVLDRVIEAYGFGSKMMLAEHLGIAASSLSTRYKRDIFPADIVVRCMAETSANLQWLATGQGKMFDNSEADTIKLPRKKIIDGKIYDSNYLIFDKAFFLPAHSQMKEPQVILDTEVQYIVDRKFTEINDGKWLVDIEGKVSIRDLTRIPIRRVRVSGVGMAFDCDLEDINVLGRVVMICA